MKMIKPLAGLKRRFTVCVNTGGEMLFVLSPVTRCFDTFDNVWIVSSSKYPAQGDTFSLFCKVKLQDYMNLTSCFQARY